jgi:hypothetical protein
MIMTKHGNHLRPTSLFTTLAALACAVVAIAAGLASAAGSKPVNTAAPAISGDVLVGGTLTATAGSWSGSTGAYAYQWQYSRDNGASWRNVNGATGATFREDSTFEHTLVRVQVTAATSSGSATATSRPVGPVGTAPIVVAPTVSAAPSVNGTLRVGQNLTATTGSWTGSPTGYAYQWQYSRNGSTWANVAGATASTFREDSTFQNAYVRVLVTATNSAGSATATGSKVGPVAAAALAATVAPVAKTAPVAAPAAPVKGPVAVPAVSTMPRIAGTTVVGSTLTTGTGTWLGSPTAYAYQWQHCDASGLSCTPVAGARAAAYTLVAGDAGATLRVVVTATSSGGSAAATTAPTAVVQAPAPVPAPSLANLTSFGSWEGSKTAEFSDPTCHNDRVTLQSTTVREGTKAATWSTDTSVHCYGDNANVRVHMLGFPSGKGVNLNNGATYWFTTSIYFPTSANIPNGWYALDEIHQSNSTGCTGPAPFNLDAAGGQWRLIVRGSTSCTNSVFNQTTWGAPVASDGSSRISRPFANGVPYTIQKGKWYDFLIGVHASTDSSGWFEAWLNGPGTNGTSVQIVPRTSLQTSYPASNYPMLSSYYPVSGNTTAEVVYDGIAFSSDFASLRAWQNSFTHSW